MAERIGEARPEGIKGFNSVLVTREAAIDSHRLANLDDPNQPLALISTNPVEGNFGLWPAANRIRQYMDYELGKPEHGGVTLEQFLSMPRQWVEFLITERRAQLERVNTIRAKEEAKQRNQDLTSRFGMDPSKL